MSKIAVYLSGQARKLDQKHLTDPILNLFPGHDVDFYFHFWESEEFSEEYIVDLFQPKNYVIESQKDFTYTAKQILKVVGQKRLTEQNYFNMLSFYYSFAQGDKIIPVDEYDYICKVRSDAFFDKDLNYLVETASNRLMLSRMAKQFPTRLADLVFFGPSSHMKLMFQIANKAQFPRECYGKWFANEKLTSHTYLKKMLDMYRMEYIELPSNCILTKHFNKGTTFKEIATEFIAQGMEVFNHLLLNNFPHRENWIRERLIEANDKKQHINSKR